MHTVSSINMIFFPQCDILRVAFEDVQHKMGDSRSGWNKGPNQKVLTRCKRLGRKECQLYIASIRKQYTIENDTYCIHIYANSIIQYDVMQYIFVGCTPWTKLIWDKCCLQNKKKWFKNLFVIFLFIRSGTFYSQMACMHAMKTLDLCRGWECN